MIELEKSATVNGHEMMVTIEYKHDGYRAVHYVDGAEVNSVDAAGCNATCSPVPEPHDGAADALEVEWQNLMDDRA